MLSVLKGLCSKNEYTKSESNSQLGPPVSRLHTDCVQRTNIQNLKAIHNFDDIVVHADYIVFKERIYKIWKQFTTIAPRQSAVIHCVQRTNIQNLKAIHNISAIAYLLNLLCSKNEYTKSESNSQQGGAGTLPEGHCVQRTNIQNLKAIHNSPLWCFPDPSLCSKNEYTKSESNSQLAFALALRRPNCVQRTNIQNLKAIHNLFEDINL